jgi:heat shock protein HtpX
VRNQLKTFALLAALSALLVAIGGAFGKSYAIGAFAMAMIMNLGAYFFSDRVVLALHRARQLSPADAPSLHALVADLAKRAGLPMPRLYLIDDPQPNAFATGRNPQHGVVAVTRGILDMLSERELRGVLAHELAHIKNRDVLIATIAAGIAAAITYLAHAAQFFAIFGGGRHDEEGDGPSGLELLLMILLAPLAATLIQLGVSRSREYHADAQGARIAGDPNALADALLKIEHGVARVPHPVEPATASLFIVNPFAGERASVLRSLFSTHPDTAERVRRLRGMSFGGSAGVQRPVLA